MVMTASAEDVTGLAAVFFFLRGPGESGKAWKSLSLSLSTESESESDS